MERPTWSCRSKGCSCPRLASEDPPSASSTELAARAFIKSRLTLDLPARIMPPLAAGPAPFTAPHHWPGTSLETSGNEGSERSQQSFSLQGKGKEHGTLMGTRFCFEALIHSREAEPWKGGRAGQRGWISGTRERSILEINLSLAASSSQRSSWGQGHRQRGRGLLFRAWCLAA